MLIVGAPMMNGEDGPSCDPTCCPNTGCGCAVQNAPGPYPSASSSSCAHTGAAYVFRRDNANGDWVADAYLKAPNAAEGDHFGSSVAISGATAVVGAPSEQNQDGNHCASGIFHYSNGENGAPPAGGYPTNSTASCEKAGAAYVFKRANGQWSPSALLKSAGGNTNVQFGHAVAMDGRSGMGGSGGVPPDRRIIVGTYPTHDGSNAEVIGSAAVFTRDSQGAWSYVNLSPPRSSATGLGSYYVFGISVALSGDTAIVGEIVKQHTGVENGAAYAFLDNQATWTVQATLEVGTAAEPGVKPGDPAHHARAHSPLSSLTPTPPPTTTLPLPHHTTPHLTASPLSFPCFTLFNLGPRLSHSARRQTPPTPWTRLSAARWQ